MVINHDRLLLVFPATIFVAGNGTISSIISSKVMLAFNHVFDVLRGDSRCRLAFLNDFFFDLLVVHNYDPVEWLLD